MRLRINFDESQNEITKAIADVIEKAKALEQATSHLNWALNGYPEGKLIEIEKEKPSECESEGRESAE